ncbi:MAG: GNAT family N-acetyltransferase [Desulfobacter sp.]|nr:MAG: GNAT family N-acetyltransferase [Desulfobacter sp.]
MNIRHPNVSDYDRVLGVMVNWWGGRDLRNKVYKGLFIHFTNTSFLAENEEGALVAFLLGYLSQTHENEGFINWMGVHPAHRNRGIGRLLCERFFDIARSHGKTRVTSSTAIINTASMNWHKHMGFTVEKTKDSFLFSLKI